MTTGSSKAPATSTVVYREGRGEGSGRLLLFSLASPAFLPGIPWMASSLTLIHAVPGNPQTSGGDDSAPCLSSTAAPTESSAAVVTPGRTAADISSSVSLTIFPITCSFRSSACDLIDMQVRLAPALPARLPELPD